MSLAESAGQVLVGAPWHDAGAAYLFSTSTGGWHQVAEVRGRGNEPGGKFGYSVASGSGVFAVGAPGQGSGRAYLFRQYGRGWRQTAELAGPAGSYFGTASALSMKAVVIGANGYRNSTGAAWASTLS